MGPIPEGEISEDHNNTILRKGYNFAENIKNCTENWAFFGLYHHKSNIKTI